MAWAVEQKEGAKLSLIIISWRHRRLRRFSLGQTDSVPLLRSFLHHAMATIFLGHPIARF